MLPVNNFEIFGKSNLNIFESNGMTVLMPKSFDSEQKWVQGNISVASFKIFQKFVNFLIGD